MFVLIAKISMTRGSTRDGSLIFHNDDFKIFGVFDDEMKAREALNKLRKLLQDSYLEDGYTIDDATDVAFSAQCDSDIYLYHDRLEFCLDVEEFEINKILDIYVGGK